MSIRILAALFVAATFCVSACAAACFGQHCVAPAPQAANEHHRHGEHSGTPAPGDSGRGDCSTHGHPGSYIKDRAAMVQTPLLVWTALPGVADVAGYAAAAVFVSPEGRDHAPPFPQSPLYQIDCSLRI